MSNVPMKVVALIPARGGSKGIPRKNLSDLCGQPLIAWSISSARRCSYFDEVWVSTDDDEIQDVALSFNARVHRRNPLTATDTASSESVVLDFLEQHPDIDIICMIQPTSPLTLPEHFSEALKLMREQKADSVVTVSRQHKFIWSAEGSPQNYDPAQRPRRQEWAGELVENGAFYFTIASKFLETQNRLAGKTCVYEMPSDFSADIDCVEDLHLCEFRLRELQDLPSRKSTETKALTSFRKLVSRSRAPVRIDLAGGWTDVPAFANLHGGEAVSFAINLYARADIFMSENDEIFVNYNCNSPLGGGLGTSASINVALMGAIDEGISSRLDIAERAYQYECILGNMGGRQDQLAAAFGGFNHFLFTEEGVSQSSLSLSALMREWIRSHVLLFDTGIRHISSEIHASVWKAFKQGVPHVIAGFSCLKRAVELMKSCLLSEDKLGVANALALVCEGVDQIDVRIHAPFLPIIQPLLESKLLSGWKAVGAGSGGCAAVLLTDMTKLAPVKRACESHGWSQIEWDYDTTGLVVETAS